MENTTLSEDKPTQEIELSDIEIKGYGLIFFLILPFFWTIIWLGIISQGLLGILIFVLLYYLLRRFDRSLLGDKLPNKITRFIAHIFYRLIKLTFGVRTSVSEPRQFRYTWFFMIGAPITFLIGILSYFSWVLVIPALFIISKRRQFLYFMLKLIVLPRGEYFDPKKLRKLSEVDRIKLEKAHQLLDIEFGYTKQKEYFHFYPPNFMARISSYLIIVLSPLILAVLIISIAQNNVNNFDLSDSLETTSGLAFALGFFGIIPYLILSLLRKYRWTRYVASKWSAGIIDGLSHSAVSTMPLVGGDYFFETNSDTLDMYHNFGFFEIFKNGRLITIFLLPLSLISYLFSLTIKQDDDSTDLLTASQFITNFSDNLRSSEFAILVFLVIPITIATLLPLIWTLSDAEIKRATWVVDDDIGEVKEISGVEDVGNMLNRYFSLFIGASAITGMTNVIRQLVGETESTLDVYIILAVVILFSVIIILPGTFFMAYRHFSLGDHAYAVNYVRYTSSKEPNIAVGTINSDYARGSSLPEPEAVYIREELELIDKKEIEDSAPSEPVKEDDVVMTESIQEDDPIDSDDLDVSENVENKNPVSESEFDKDFRSMMEGLEDEDPDNSTE